MANFQMLQDFYLSTIRTAGEGITLSTERCDDDYSDTNDSCHSAAQRSRVGRRGQSRSEFWFRRESRNRLRPQYQGSWRDFAERWKARGGNGARQPANLDAGFCSGAMPSERRTRRELRQ